MPLHVDHRPKDFDEIIGNKATIQSLKSIFNRKSDYPHLILLQGNKGCGKTTLGRIIASKLLNKKDLNKNDYVQIDGGDVNASYVRQLKSTVKYKPLNGKSKIFIIEEAHMIGSGGDSEKNPPQNNLLTLLEEPPDHVYFILCTTDPQRLLGTIRSRSVVFEVNNLNHNDIIKLLNRILEKELDPIDVSEFPKKVLNKIAEVCDGCPREALTILDKIIDMKFEDMLDAIESFNFIEKNIFDLYNGLCGRDKWDDIIAILKQMDLNNYEQLRRSLIGLAAKNILQEEDRYAMLIYDAFRKPFYDNGKNDFIFAAYQTFLELQ